MTVRDLPDPKVERFRTNEGRLRCRVTCSCGHIEEAPFECPQCGREYNLSGQALRRGWQYGGDNA